MPHPDRRDVLSRFAGAAFAGATQLPDVRDGGIANENRLLGTLDWQLTYTRVDPKTKFRSPQIEGYCSRTSVKAGEAIEFFVSTDGSPFVIDLYRMGYYGGTGGRFVQRLG